MGCNCEGYRKGLSRDVGAYPSTAHSQINLLFIYFLSLLAGTPSQEIIPRCLIVGLSLLHEAAYCYNAVILCRGMLCKMELVMAILWQLLSLCVHLMLVNSITPNIQRSV